LVIGFENKGLAIKNIEGPVGVRGRNSDNKLIKEMLNWTPSYPLEKGMKKVYNWIKKQIEDTV